MWGYQSIFSKKRQIWSHNSCVTIHKLWIQCDPGSCRRCLEVKNVIISLCLCMLQNFLMISMAIDRFCWSHTIYQISWSIFTTSYNIWIITCHSINENVFYRFVIFDLGVLIVLYNQRWWVYWGHNCDVFVPLLLPRRCQSNNSLERLDIITQYHGV